MTQTQVLMKLRVDRLYYVVSGLNADMRQDTRKHLSHNSRLGWGRDGVEVVLGQYNSTLKIYSPNKRYLEF